MKYINIGNRISVELHGEAPIQNAISNEFSELVSVSVHYDIIGKFFFSKEHLSLPNDAILLLDKRLYYNEDAVFVLSGKSCHECRLEARQFLITVDSNSDISVVVDLLQALLNYYMPLFGMTFLHTAAFRVNDKVCSIHAFGGSGKTETMLQALYDGAEFISDDLAVFNEKGEIFPYPRKISLHGYKFTDDELSRFGMNKSHYRRLNWLKRHPNRITNFLYRRWKWEFHIKIDYKTITGKSTAMKFYNVDYHFWLDSNGKAGISEMDKVLFAKKIKFCMQNEFCAYINYNGYFSTIIPFWKDIEARYNELIGRITSTIDSIENAKISNEEYTKMKDMIYKKISYVNIGDKLLIQLTDNQHDVSMRGGGVVQYMINEYIHHIEDKVTLPVIGIVYESGVILPHGAIELRKGFLYEKDDDLYVHTGKTTIRIHAKEGEFEIEINRSSDNEISFFTLEMLIRMYAPLYDIVFMHTAGFRYKGKTCTVNAFGGVGKTEVMIKALERGASFISDDFAIYNSKGQVYPYTKRLYLCEYPYDDWMLSKLKKSKLLWKLQNWCIKHTGPVTSRIQSRFERKYFGVKVDYRELTNESTKFEYTDVDYFYWVDNSDVTGYNTIDSNYFENRMNLCLDIESRRYCDYDGYLRLKYPFLERYKKKQQDILHTIAAKQDIQGLTIRNHQFRELSNLILGQIN